MGSAMTRKRTRLMALVQANGMCYRIGMTQARDIIRDTVQHQAHWLELADRKPVHLVLGHMEWGVIERAALLERTVVIVGDDAGDNRRSFMGFPVSVHGYTGVRLLVEAELADAGL